MNVTTMKSQCHMVWTNYSVIN